MVNIQKRKGTEKEGDEPFILACQANQVFYSKDQTRPGWSVVLMAPKRLTKEVDAIEDPSLFSSFDGENANLENVLKEIEYELQRWTCSSCEFRTCFD